MSRPKLALFEERIDQTILADGSAGRPGNCLSACVATWLGRPLEEVPHFIEVGAKVDGPDGGVAWWMLLIGYMAAHGYWPVELDSIEDPEPGEVSFVMGMSERGVLHQVLYCGAHLYHDPHPSRAGLVDVREVMVWRPVTHNHQGTP